MTIEDLKLEEGLLCELSHTKLKPKKPTENVHWWNYVEVKEDIRIYYTYAKHKLYFVVAEHLNCDDFAEAMMGQDKEFPYIWDHEHSFVRKQGEGMIEQDGIFYFTITQFQPNIPDTQALFVIINELEINYLKYKSYLDKK